MGGIGQTLRVGGIGQAFCQWVGLVKLSVGLGGIGHSFSVGLVRYFAGVAGLV